MTITAGRVSQGGVSEKGTRPVANAPRMSRNEGPRLRVAP
jgi:hypothetical protein